MLLLLVFIWSTELSVVLFSAGNSSSTLSKAFKNYFKSPSSLECFRPLALVSQKHYLLFIPWKSVTFFLFVSLGQVAAGFADHTVRVWRTARNAPYPSLATQTHQHASSNPLSTQGGYSSVPVGKSTSPLTNDTAAAVEEPFRFVAHSRPVYGLSWSPDGRFLLTGGGGGDVWLWDMARGKSGNAAGCACYDGHK